MRPKSALVALLNGIISICSSLKHSPDKWTWLIVDRAWKGMKSASLFPVLIPFLMACNESGSIKKARNEIFQTEKAFEEMASVEGLAKAFYFFAADDAVIRRGNDSIISGKENIRIYYLKNANPDARLSWTPDFIGVSDCGTLGYTYGRYVYSATDSTGNKTERTGIFHTVWKKQKNDWRFVWD